MVARFTCRCVKGTCVVSGPCTDISSAHRSTWHQVKSQTVMHHVVVARTIPLLGSRVLRGSQPVISSSQASSGTSVCVVTSRNVLCNKRLTKSWKMMTAASAMLHNLFSDSETERRCCKAHRTREVLCDPDNTVHTNAFIGRFSFLKQHSCWPKEHTTFHSRTLVFVRSPIPVPFTCCQVPPRSGLMNFFATFLK